MMLIGADCWLPPTQAVIDELKKLDGFSFMCGYVGGPDLYKNEPWPIEAWNLLKSNGISPVPIWVPRQNCAEDPVASAKNAMDAVEANGMTGLVAIDSEAMMAQVLNFQSHLDLIYQTIDRAGWKAVNYAGAHYVSQLAYLWEVVWGEHQLIPNGAQMLQYGPYKLMLPDGTIVNLDSDACDEFFPFAEWIGEVPQPQPVTTNQKESPLYRFSCTTPGHTDYVVFPNGHVHGIANQTELDEWAASGIPAYPMALGVYEITCQELGVSG